MLSRILQLHLHPESMKISDEPPAYGSNANALPTIEIPPLPTSVTLKKVYSDFLKYMFTTSRNFFQANTPNGKSIWERLEDKMILILCIPNGWDTAQQGFLREAVVTAGVMTHAQTDMEAADGRRRRLEFVTEGEASVHYALAHTHSHTWLEKNTLFAVTDAGGSTVDSTLYECKQTTPELVLEEVCASECVQVSRIPLNFLISLRVRRSDDLAGWRCVCGSCRETNARRQVDYVKIQYRRFPLSPSRRIWKEGSWTCHISNLSGIAKHNWF